MKKPARWKARSGPVRSEARSGTEPRPLLEAALPIGAESRTPHLLQVGPMPCIILVKKPLVFFLSNVGDAQEIIETHTRLHDGHTYISHVVHAYISQAVSSKNRNQHGRTRDPIT